MEIKKEESKDSSLQRKISLHDSLEFLERRASIRKTKKSLVNELNIIDGEENLNVKVEKSNEEESDSDNESLKCNKVKDSESKKKD